MLGLSLGSAPLYWDSEKDTGFTSKIKNKKNQPFFFSFLVFLLLFHSSTCHHGLEEGMGDVEMSRSLLNSFCSRRGWTQSCVVSFSFSFFLSVFFLTFIYKCPVTFSSAQSEWRKVFFILLAWLNMSGKIFRNVLFIDCCWQMDTLCLKCLRPWYLPFSPPPSSQHTPWSVQAVLI